MALPPSELWQLELREFLSIHNGWRNHQEYSERMAWERTRWEVCAIISPWLKGNKSMTELLPLPWDEKIVEEDIGYNPEDMDARRARVEQLIKSIYGREVSESID